ncbi:hypothetical protein R1sor_015910 [Riccia sorocarpa]|uniref:Uncharacterized protein n=1 Tax=Riccia sorocarpa TaxID=122646 RepID=A0ABD3HFH2_9MARC
MGGENAALVRFVVNPHLQAEAIRMNCGGELLEDGAFVTAVEPKTEPIDDLPMKVEWNVLNYESMVSQALAKLRIADANPFDLRGPYGNLGGGWVG